MHYTGTACTNLNTHDILSIEVSGLHSITTTVCSAAMYVSNSDSESAARMAPLGRKKLVFINDHKFTMDELYKHQIVI